MSTTTTLRWTYLTRKPGSNYRQLFIKDRNIAAFTLYCMTLEGDGPAMTPAEVAADYDLPLEAVREAIAYCQSHPPEIQQDWEADEALAEATGMNDPRQRFSARPKHLSPQEKAGLSGS